MVKYYMPSSARNYGEESGHLMKVETKSPGNKLETLESCFRVPLLAAKLG